MRPLVFYFISLGIGVGLIVLTPYGAAFGVLRWPVVLMTCIMSVMASIGFYHTQRARYYVLGMLVCVPYLPMGLIPAYGFKSWVDGLGF